MEVWNKYFGKIDESKMAVLLKVLTQSLELCPEAKPAMPYGVPGLKLSDKNLIAVAAHKEHYGICPFSPKVIEELQPLLNNLETAKGTIRFSYDDNPSNELLEKLIELRAAELK